MPIVTIRNKDGEFLEEHEIEGSFLSWIKQTCRDEGVEFRDSVRPPYSAKLNGEHWDYKDHDVTLNSGDKIDVTIEPGWEAVPFIIAALAAAYAYYVASNIKTPYQNTAVESGTSIYAANARANITSPSGVIREMAGEQHIYPDYICPPHRKFIDNDEWLFLNLAVTRGFADVATNNLFIAETPVSYYEGDISFQIKDPGEDVSGSIAHENWFQSKEILSLRLISAAGLIGGSWTLDALDNDFTSYNLGVAAEFPFNVGEHFRITGGSNAGVFRVNSISGGSNEVASVVQVEYEGGTTGRLEVLSQQSLNPPGFRGMSTPRRTIFNDLGVPILNPTVGEAISSWESLNGAVNWEGPFQATPINETARYCEVDVAFPRGLVELDDDNNQINRFVRIIIRWRDRGTAQWTEVTVDTNEKTYDELGKTVTIDFGSEITPELMFRRVTEDADDISISDIVEIVRVKCLLQSPTSYPNVTTIQMQLRGTNALAQTAENKVNVRGASRKLPTLQEIEDAANGTPFDLGGDKNVDTTWQIQYSDFVSAFDFDFDNKFPRDLNSIDVSSDGLHVLVNEDGIMKFFALNAPFDFRNPVYTGNYTINTGNTGDRLCARFLDSGTKMLFIYPLTGTQTVTARAAIVPLGTAYDPTTAGALSSKFLSSLMPDRASLFMKSDGTQFWYADNELIRELTLTTAFDITTASFTGDELDVSSDISPDLLSGIYFGDNLSRMWVSTDGGKVYAYTLSTPGDITTASLESFDSVDVNECRDVNVLENHLIVCSIGTDPLSSIEVYEIPDTVNVRRSRSIVRFIANAVYDAIGDGVLDQLDFDALDTLDTLLEFRDDYLDAEFSDETTLWEAIKIMASPGYSEPVIKEGVFDLVRIAEGTDFSALYTPDIMLGDGLQTDMGFYGSQEPDGVDIEYFSLATYSNEVYEYRLPGDLGLRPKRIQAIGIGTEEKAFRMAARERRRIRAKPATYTFTTELDALNSNYGDPIAIASDVFGSQYGHVIGVSGSIIDLSFDYEAITGSPVATFRDPDGSMSSTHSVSLGPASNQITLVSPSSPSFTLITDENEEPNLVSLGNTSDYVKRAIVRRISPQNNNEVQVTAEEYVADIYTDDDNSPS
jgi:hypothetical protein